MMAHQADSAGESGVICEYALAIMNLRVESLPREEQFPFVVAKDH